jgi:hypothetical protein
MAKPDDLSNDMVETSNVVDEMAMVKRKMQLRVSYG